MATKHNPPEASEGKHDDSHHCTCSHTKSDHTAGGDCLRCDCSDYQPVPTPSALPTEAECRPYQNGKGWFHTPGCKHVDWSEDAGFIAAAQAQPQESELESLFETRLRTKFYTEYDDMLKADLKALLAAEYTRAQKPAVEAAIRHVVGAEIDPKYLRKATAKVLQQLTDKEPKHE